MRLITSSRPRPTARAEYDVHRHWDLWQCSAQRERVSHLLRRPTFNENAKLFMSETPKKRTTWTIQRCSGTRRDRNLGLHVLTSVPSGP